MNIKHDQNKAFRHLGEAEIKKLKFLTDKTNSDVSCVPLLVGENFQSLIYMNIAMYQTLIDIMSDLTDGKLLVTIDSNYEMTTTEAAKVLGCSRVHVVTLIETGILKSKKVGKHRRVDFDDVMNYIKEKNGNVYYHENSHYKKRPNQAKRRFHI
jgi:excisionase family DNA binding protein